MILFDIDGNIWFKLKDVYKILGYSNLKDLIFKNNLNDKYKKSYDKIKVYPLWGTPYNFQKNTIFVNEPGLYYVLLKSEKPKAKIFLEKLTFEIMPKIRETGQYIVNSNEQEKINKLNDKIKNLKMKNNNLTEENIYLDKKYRFKPSNSGYLYIISVSCIKRGKSIML